MFLNQFEAKKFNVNEIVDLRPFIKTSGSSDPPYKFVVTRRTHSTCFYQYYKDTLVKEFDHHSSNEWVIFPTCLVGRPYIITNTGENIYTFSLEQKDVLLTVVAQSYQLVRLTFSARIIWEDTQIILVRNNGIVTVSSCG